MKKKLIITLSIFSLSLATLVGCGTEKGKELNKNDEIHKVTDEFKQKDKLDKKDLGEKTEREEENKEEAQETLIIEAMYIPLEDSYIFASEQSGVFTILGDEYEVLNMDGETIHLNELVAGNKTKITSNGIMLESYPGQLAGVTKIEVFDEGNENDITQYQDIIDELIGGFEENDTLPTLSVLYTTSIANTSVSVNNGGYEWTFEDENDGTKTEVADEAPVRLWGDMLIDIVLEENTDLELEFSKDIKDIEIKAYSSEWIGKEDELLESETTTVIPVKKNGTYVIENAEKDLIYEIAATFENGKVNYGFYTK